MWFLLFSMGAIALGAAGLPAVRRLPVAPPPEVLVAGYFLVAALLRLLVRNARLAAFERKARREARRKDDKAPSVMGELGLGVGRGALQAVAGDVLGAGLSLAAALFRGAASSLSAPPPPQRERRRAMRWEQLKAAICIAGVGLVCAGVAWEPLVHHRVVRAADAAVREGFGQTATATVPATPTPTPTPSPAARVDAGSPAALPERGAAGATLGTPGAAGSRAAVQWPR